MSDQNTIEGILLPPETETGSLLQVAESLKPLDLFTSEPMAQKIIAMVRQKAAEGFEPDTSTDKGRKAIASRAYRVASTKTFLDDIGKAEVARLKELPKQVDAIRKILRDGLDEIRDETRKALTDWEKIRDEWKRKISFMQNLPATVFNSDQVAIREAIATVDAVDPNDYQEMAKDFTAAKIAISATLREQLEKRLKWEADQAELERLRQEKAERDRLDREEQLRKEGEERARLKRILDDDIKAAHQEPEDEPEQEAPEESVECDSALVVNGDSFSKKPAVAIAEWPSVEHRREYNREAMEDIGRAVFNDLGQTSLDIDPIAKSVIIAIVKGEIRHVSIKY